MRVAQVAADAMGRATDVKLLAAFGAVLGMLAFGPNSDIYRKLVIRDQKVQSLSGDFALGRDPGLLSIVAMINTPEGIPGVRAEIQATVEKYRTTPCDPKLLSETKSAMKYRFLMGLETPQGINFALRDFAVFTGGIEAVEEYYKTLDSIAPADIQAAAQKYLVETGRTTVTMVSAREGNK